MIIVSTETIVRIKTSNTSNPHFVILIYQKNLTFLNYITKYIIYENVTRLR